MGAPSQLPPQAADIVTLIEQLYAEPDGGTGGPLHKLLDDFDVDCIEPFRALDWEPQTWRLAELVAAYMRPLSRDQRAAVLAAWEGWIERRHASTRPVPDTAGC
jgi:hypothetical protein